MNKQRILHFKLFNGQGAQQFFLKKLPDIPI